MREIPSEIKCSFFLPLVWLLVSTLLLHTAKINAVANQDADTKRRSYIVYMGERKHSDVEQITKSHHEMLVSVLGSKEAATDSMIYSYRHGFSGFAAKMTASQAKYFEGLPDVVQVLPNRLYKLHSTRSWDFLGLSASSTTNLLHYTNQGDGIIIGVLDSGVWPDLPSFNDKGLGPIPSKWKGHCQSGDAFVASKHCNKKLIGARYFIDGLLAAAGGGEPFNATQYNEYLSPRDADGHGTHCSSTAGGSFVSNVSVGGLAHGTARGGAPRARIAMYKVVWSINGVTTGSSADVLKAYDEAIYDGVDVFSISIGGDLPLYPEFDSRDTNYYGSFHAVAHGITVVCAGGNSGPLTGTVSDVAPWVITVGATSVDRAFPNPIILGNNQVIEGQGLYRGEDTGFLKLVFFKEEPISLSTLSCEDLKANDTWVAGAVVFCFTKVSEDSLDQIGLAVVEAGGLGVIITKKTISSPSQYSSNFPILLVSFEVGSQILSYIRNTKDPKVRIKPAQNYVGKKATTFVGSFSSRGPSSISPAVLKPDIAAPGVDILAGIVPSYSYPDGYGFETGTSMASPHIAGIAALLKSLHPNWSPAAIKSALVTTAWTTDPYTGEPIYAKGEINRIADHFDYGGGLVNPNAARDPGLIYDMGIQDYTNYLCAMGYPETAISKLARQAKSCPKSGNSVLDLNLPSITVPNLKRSVTVTRTVTNVGDPNSKYQVVIVPPQGTVMKVNPMYLLFNPHIKKLSFTVTITSFHNTNTEYYFGSLTWIDKVHHVRIPISVKTEFSFLGS